MGKKEPGLKALLRISVILAMFLCLGGLLFSRIGILEYGEDPAEGLSAMVAVKGAVGLEDLALTESEVTKINQSVDAHKGTFNQVDLFLDVKGGANSASKSTVLVWAMVLETNGDCEVRSWSRKVTRGDLVRQMVMYMDKAAQEYQDFKRYPDVKQNFKCLYI